MARTTPGVTRQRIVDEATKLFGSNGYAATSIADIQQACGLTGGSGALYKHFPSKKALLDEIIRQHLSTITEGGRQAQELPEDPRAALPLIGRIVWDGMARDHDALRIVFRELDRFPELLEQMWDTVLGGIYVAATEWIRAGVDQGRMTVADPKATAAVLFASLTYYRILGALVGHTPGDVPEEAYLAAWTEHAVVTLGIEP
ncbi:TetR/AcrR family transcriptional regulator [Amycolatopsis nigrescens]|uniref:TetR/AcrR family transcriptional regulator n=1 Tax=Amycolatopsis nigrescens TaxID=381445 RepID=UPI000686063C|nr:TetR/AcrR family transcriptional regulator [Amycolatopsis nigrescens]